MNAEDMLALARFAAYVELLNFDPSHEAMPLLDTETHRRLVSMVEVVALQLAEQAGDRGRELWKATQ